SLGRRCVTRAGLDQKNELDRTAALRASLDAVVSAPTAVSWLAAGTGVDTYKVLYDTSWTAFGQLYEAFAPAWRVGMARAARRLDRSLRANPRPEHRAPLPGTPARRAASAWARSAAMRTCALPSM